MSELSDLYQEVILEHNKNPRNFREIADADRTMIEAIVERDREHSFKPSFEAVEIVPGNLGESAAAIGVALLSKSA